MSRRRKLVGELDLTGGFGAEIGALDHPMVMKEQGRVLYIDHADSKSLREKYASDPNVDVSRIVQVDAVWGEKTLKECLAEAAALDYIIASHVIEHVPDLISWLGEIRAVIKETGQVRLAVPDRRYSFDLIRRETRLCDVVDAYIRRARVPLPIAILDHISNTRVVDVRAAWAGTIDPAGLKPLMWTSGKMSYDLLTAPAIESLTKEQYRDVHCWIFTPMSFADLFHEMAVLGLHDFGCLRYFDTNVNENEFIVWLGVDFDSDERLQSWKRMRNGVRDAPMNSVERRVRDVPKGMKRIARWLGNRVSGTAERSA